MRTIHFRLSEGCDVADALARFSDECKRFDPGDRQHVVREVHAIVSDLERIGQELAAIGSQFRTDKLIEFPSCKVRIMARYGVPQRGWLPSWFRSLLGIR
jgi:hypothetical protein